MSDFAIGFWVSFVIWALVALFGSLPLMVGESERSSKWWRNEIVKHGGGYYAIDNQGTSSWHWNADNEWNTNK